MSGRHYGARVRTFEEQGRSVVSLENEVLRVELLPHQGSDIVSFLHKPSDVDVLWRSTRSKSAPSPERTTGPNSATYPDLAAYLDSYEGGWRECLPNGGPGVIYRGAAIPFHGELWSASWNMTVVEDTPMRVAVRLRTATSRTPFVVEKVLSIESGRAALIIDESITNQSMTPVQYMWGHHPAFGAPFLDDTCHIDLPPAIGTTRRAAPLPNSQLAFDRDFTWPYAPLSGGGQIDLSQVPGRDVVRSEWVCLSGLNEGWYGLTSARLGVGFGLRWDVAILPYLWFWQEWSGERNDPREGRQDVFALEPWTSWPDAGLVNAIANGTAPTLGPMQSVSTRMIAVAYSGRDRIGGITESGELV